MHKLTARQSEILQFIQTHIEERGFPPTRLDIMRALGFKSPNAAEDHLRALAKKGAINLLPGASRGIQIPQTQPKGLPLVGRVAAGSPLLAEEHIEHRYPIEPSFFSPRADYLLRVRGLSMIDAGILEDDLLAVHRTDQVQNGQIVVARIQDEVTVKRFEKRGQKVKLIAENPDFSPIELDLTRDSLTIEGLGVGIIRAGRPL
jgi:repressor LexA